MDLVTKDFGFITEESFDFEFPSSDSLEHVSQDVMEASLMGSVKHVEHCVVRSIDLNAQDGASGVVPEPVDWGSVGAEKLEEVYREANHLARQLKRVALKENLAQSPLVGALIKGKEPQRSPRRETYVVKDSPVRLLLPDISFEGEDGLVSLKLHTNSNTVTPTRAKPSPTRAKAISSETKTTSLKKKTTPNACKTTPTTPKMTSKTKAILTEAAKTVGKAADQAKPTTVTVPSARTVGRSTNVPVTHTRHQMTSMKSKSNASWSSSDTPTVAVLHQPLKPSRGTIMSFRSSSTQQEKRLCQSVGLRVCPVSAHGVPGAHKGPCLIQKVQSSVNPTVVVTSNGNTETSKPAVCAEEDSKSKTTSFSAAQATHRGSAHQTTSRKVSGKQTASSAYRAVPRAVPSQSAPQSKLVTSNTGVSRLPVYRSLPAARSRFSQSVSQGIKVAPAHCSISEGDIRGHRKGPGMVSK